MALRPPKKETQKNGTPEKQQGPGNMFLMFVMMLIVFLVGAGMVIGYFKFFDPDNKEAKTEEKKKEKVVLASMDLGEMVINLADGNHFLKTEITIEYPEDKKMEELISEKKHQVIEIILLTLRKKTVDDVAPPEATDKLKRELIKAINAGLNEDVVKKIYFTQYIVQ
ncbi:flagellar basal body-associated FliL family protein [Desulfallas sp. Bu1-1]|uniref:flagellar basal body-associated FliL family protein n=1 Tax=Desulfallas sp. Bu1-1 TaxID=2787620 RepID=UPI00189E3693|nr:flagellar basal body-associated FliL family protein [Desulfallas sp. Bu1-1]MBF7081955.1 flagellar basal body-associated FliL family protein [Desulfallas sp. Bu1-1]